MSIVKLNNRGVRSVTAFGSLSSGAMTFISKQTASSSSTISFTSGIDSTYKEYLFTFKNIHPATDSAEFTFNLSADSGSNYNVTKTTSLFQTYHNEDESVDSGTAVQYTTASDLAQSTAFQELAVDCGNGNDECVSGTMQLFNPSSTTFVKHFMFTGQQAHQADQSQNNYVAGYFNTTSAIDAVQFKMSSGNIDAGDICLYGIN